MQFELPGRVRVIREAQGTRFVLPPRDLGKARGFGVAVTVFGLFVTGFMVLWMSGPLLSGLRSRSADRWLSLAFGLMGLPGLVVGLGILLLGIGITFNLLHSEIAVDRERLRSIEKMGPLAWSRRRRRKDIVRLVVGGGLLSAGGRPGQGLPLAAIRVDAARGKSMYLAPAYSRELVEDLAAVLSQALGTVPVVKESMAQG